MYTLALMTLFSVTPDDEAARAAVAVAVANLSVTKPAEVVRPAAKGVSRQAVPFVRHGQQLGIMDRIAVNNVGEVFSPSLAPVQLQARIGINAPVEMRGSINGCRA